jgi:hypothetical protein
LDLADKFNPRSSQIFQYATHVFTNVVAGETVKDRELIGKLVTKHKMVEENAKSNETGQELRFLHPVLI